MSGTAGSSNYLMRLAVSAVSLGERDLFFAASFVAEAMVALAAIPFSF